VTHGSLDVEVMSDFISAAKGRGGKAIAIKLEKNQG
jgi:hypothetical protein